MLKDIRHLLEMLSKRLRLRQISVLLVLALAIASCVPIVVCGQTNIDQNNLLPNGGFDSGGNSWSADGANDGYFYTFNTTNPNNETNTIASIGWWSGVAVWQAATTVYQPNIGYTLTARVRVGQSDLTGVNLSFQDPTLGWANVSNQNFTFPIADQTMTPGPWRIFSLNLNTNTFTGNVADTIGVGVALYESPSTNQGWLHLDWVQLAPTVPQFTLQPQNTTGFYYSTATFTANAVGAVTNTTGVGSALLYQWYKAPSTLLAGATNASLTLTNLAGTNGGNYYVVATGAYGTTASSNALLSVTQLTLTLNDTNVGRVFEGIGAVSASATSRLLLDYPEPQRSQILDCLFKPNYGAALQHLKVEIGGEVNSTDGCEPTHQRTATDTNFTRGYEWWLMQQARQRNPSILLDSLAWGAPGWIGGGTYYSQDMANYIANFLNGAKNVYGLNINYTGVRNETANNTTWIKLLRATLNTNGLQSVKIVAGDEWGGTWNIVNNILSDSALSNAVYAVGGHYPSNSPAAGQAPGQPLGQSLWASEDGPGFGDWWNAPNLAARYNRNYIQRRLTKTEIWCPLTSFYDVLIAAGAGLMRANTPWSGNYAVLPGIWVTAHTTQFAQPGWTYLEGGASAMLPQGGSVVSLKSTNNYDWSIVAETSDATVSQTATIRLTNGLSTGPVYVWSSTSSQQFIKVATLTPVNGAFTFSFQPSTIYTLTTTTGQSKGATAPSAPASFSLPYKEDFESYAPGAVPRYFLPQAGTFEVTNRNDGRGRCLAQVLPQQGLEWTSEFYPYTLVGDSTWSDYDVSTDVELNTNEWAFLWGRVSSVPGWSSATPTGYWLAANNNPGGWKLLNANGVIVSGSLPFAAGGWHNLRLAMQGSWIQAWVDGTQVAKLSDTSCSSGLAGVGCGWQCFPQFDNFTVRQLHRGEPNLALTATASASSYFNSAVLPSFANDGNFSTYWSAGYPPLANEWLELDFPLTFNFNTTTLSEFSTRILGYHLQHWTGSAWNNDALGGMISGLVTNNPTTNTFSMVGSTKERLLVTNLLNSPAIYEFQVYNIPQQAGSIRINEWMINNTKTIADPADGQFHSWFELYNAGTTNFNLSGYYLTGTPTNLVQFQIPSGYHLAPGGCLLVWADGLTAQNQPSQPNLHVNFTLAQSQIIGLFATNGSQVDAITLSAQPADTSSGSKTDGDLAVLPLAVATPGAANTVIKVLSVAPVASHGGMLLTFSGLPFAMHRVQYTASLASASWTTAANVTADGLGAFNFTDTNAPLANQRFYRAVCP